MTSSAVAGLAVKHRLVTLTGAGGSGKTRLATETARTMLAELPDGAWLVELASVRAGGELAQAALTAIGLRDQALLGGCAGRGADGSAHRRGPGARDLADPGQLRARDRGGRGFRGSASGGVPEAADPGHEQGAARYHRGGAVAGRAARAAREGADPAEAGSSPAVRLLRDRAVWCARTSAPTCTPSSAMARICRALDGMPLAIELAAARLRAMSVEQLARRLDDRFRLLTGGSRTALPRHQTLRAVVDWSWELLTEPERGVLRRLSVFSGGVEPGGGRAGVRGRGDPPRTGVRRADRADREVAAARPTARARRATGCSTPSGSTRRSGWPKPGRSEPAPPGAPDVLHRAGRDGRAAPAPGRAAGVAVQARRRARQHQSALRGAIAEGWAQEAMRLVAAAGWYWYLSGHRAEGAELSIAAASLQGEVVR